ncbi:hypothetical protein FB451DRAFT_1568037 [Mycena latifolia]|nr:hypothetical protein FB451DRAFT_1568037 [Mycena latifolia]
MSLSSRQSVAAAVERHGAPSSRRWPRPRRARLQIRLTPAPARSTWAAAHACPTARVALASAPRHATYLHAPLPAIVPADSLSPLSHFLLTKDAKEGLTAQTPPPAPRPPAAPNTLSSTDAAHARHTARATRHYVPPASSAEGGICGREEGV